jgi:alpha-galactosidase
MRNQLVLDLSNPEVQKFVFDLVDGLLTKNPELAFIKWDCNSVIYNAHSKYLEKNGRMQSQLYVDYVRGLYDVLEKLRAKHPQVPMMLCSGGGGRVDYGALKYFTEFWVSDNTDPLERIFQQWEYSYFFPAIAHCNHVTDWGKQPIKFRTDVAMMGKLGYDIVVSKLDPKDLAFSKQAVEVYKSINDVVWHGDLFRLVDPKVNPYAALSFVSKDKSKAVLFSYLVSNRYMLTASPMPVKLEGLDAMAKYTVREINLYPGTRSPLEAAQTFSGEFLMKVGINSQVGSNRTSVILEIEKSKQTKVE